MSENKPSQSGGPTDPLASLHRMSTTAGIASQEYVAINLAAVAALVLGLASALVLMGNILLVIPAAALVFGLVAMKHISASNGTQTGRGLALLGMMVAVGFSAFIGGREYRAHVARQAELAVIEKVVSEFEQKLLTKDIPGSLLLFSDTFMQRKEMTAERYQDIMSHVVTSPAFGDLQSIKTNQRVELADAQAGAGRSAATMLVFQFSKANRPMRLQASFRKSGGQWRLEDIPDMFPNPQKPPEGGPGGGPGAPGEGMGPPR